MTITFHDGRRAPYSEDERPRLKFAQVRGNAPLPARPTLVDYVSRVAEWPMYGNDQYGDCVWAAAGHIIEAGSTYGTGTTVQVTDTDVFKGYHDVTGWVPDDPNTDQGTVIQDALDYWRKTGIGGHKILGFTQVDVKNLDEVAEALYLLGHLELGINFPDSAMDQFNNGEPWDVVAGARNEGGHAVNLGLSRDTAANALPKRGRLTGRNARGNFEIVTWGRVQEMTPAFWAKYVEEAWITLLPEWFAAAGGSPEGIDQATLGEAFTELTGDPFPAVAPTPPSPGPSPAPPADDVKTEIARMVRDLKKGWDVLVKFLSEHGL